MRKLNLIALSYERDRTLDVLERTGAAEIKLRAEEEGTRPLQEEGGELAARLASWEEALDLLTREAEKYAKAHDVKDFSSNGEISVSYAEFLAARNNLSAVEEIVKEIGRLAGERDAALAERARLERAAAAALPYRSARKFTSYTDTRHTVTKLGLVPANLWETCRQQLDGLSLAAYQADGEGENVLLSVTVHKSALAEAELVLGAAGFTACPYRDDCTGEELLLSLGERARAEEERAARAEEKLFGLSPSVKELKIGCDALRFELEKAEQAEKMRGTERTFLLEAFVPAAKENDVKAALDGSGITVFYEFSDPAEDEFVPTLLKNNKVVENFETITNMYSPPNARELDPNTVMSFFYSVFIGFIMADVGYGLMMMLGGGFLYYKNRARQKGGIKSLAGVFAIGGVFAVIWGFLFNSILGMQFLPFTVMPDAQSEMYNLVGISIPGVLVISLLIGVVQLAAGYLCKCAQLWRRGKPLDGILDGGIWALFSVGVELAIVGLVEEFHLSFLASAGGILAGAMLVVAVFTAGRHEKLLGKFTKGFGSLYGLINYFTDVLSYIRLYGLMLTGAVIAQIISQYSVSFLTSGSALVVVGAVLMVVGHVFNLAISLLGAYIHTARLQYVEFFGRFYEGEGELFVPLGSARKYVRVV